MECPECAADVHVLREFCPQCGSPMDPGLAAHKRGARGQRTVEELRSNRKTILIGGAAIVLAFAAVGRFGLSGPSIHIDTDAPRKAPAVVEAQQVYDAFHEDPAAAAKRFDGREMVVSGEFLRIVPDGYNSLDMRLKTSNPDVPVGVDLAGLAVEDAKKLQPGQRVTVSCQGMGGGGSDPWLRDCAIQSQANLPGGPAGPPEPPAPPPPEPPKLP
ncbi:hypothetical protein GCM10023264_25160 [Sphingomonas daechungensis]|uniref:hypothetical protein n=1 Tax=Sphingomonas daechungensis TaxID=1176646 RepID=UPI0031E86BE7